MNDQRLKVAILIAQKTGDLKNPELVSPTKSGPEGSDYLLIDRKRNLIAKINLEHLDEQVNSNPESPIPYTQPKPERIDEASIKKSDNSSNSPRSLSTKEKAIQWAKSMGYPIPEPPMDGASAVFIVVLAFLLCIVPGIFAILTVQNRQTKYDREISMIINKWIEAGKPEPGDPGLKPAAPQSEVQKPESSVEDKIKELFSMKEKGLLTEEEFSAAKAKILGI